MIPESVWKWYGNAAHFICGMWCRFHLATVVGEYIVSTVGEYIHPRHSGAAGQNEGEYLKKHPLGEEIGCDRLFETMVFRAGKPCTAPECGCGLPEIDGDEQDFDAYNDRKSATEGHAAMCKKWASHEV